MKRNFKIVASLTLILILLIAAKVTTAQESSTGLIAAPPFISENIGSGAEIEEKIRITNHRDTDEDIYIVSREIGIDQNGDFYTPEGLEEGATSIFEQEGWLTFEPRQFFLKRGEGQLVTVRIQMPENLPTKGYYLELAATTQPPEAGERQVGLAPEIAIPIAINYIGIGEEIRNLEIVSFKTDRVLYEYPPVKFETHLSNKGNVHIIPVGQIFISRNREFKDNEGSLGFNEGGQRIFAQAGRRFENIWKEAFIIREDSGEIKVDWNKLTEFRIGKYYAQLNVAWDGKEGKEYISAETSFWVFPWKILIVILLIVLIIIGLILLKKWRRKGLKKYVE